MDVILQIADYLPLTAIIVGAVYSFLGAWRLMDVEPSRGAGYALALILFALAFMVALVQVEVINR